MRAQTRPATSTLPWRDSVIRAARMLYLSPLVALALAPAAVFFRGLLVILALWHGAWAWQLTARAEQPLTSRLVRSGWILRALGLAGIGVITLDYDGYRALLLATVAAYLVYVSALLSALGLPAQRALRPAAWGAALSCALVTIELVLRRSAGVAWGTMPGHCLSAIGVPLGILAWLELQRIGSLGPKPERKAESAALSSATRAWAMKVAEVVIPVCVGAGVALVALLAGFWVAWEHADLEPGVLRSAALFALFCANGALLLVLRRWGPGALRRAIAGAALTHVPLCWLLEFPTQFNAPAWKRAAADSPERSEMAEDLVYSRVLIGKTRGQVADLLGPSRGYGTPPDHEHYALRSHDCRGIDIAFDGTTVSRAHLILCD